MFLMDKDFRKLSSSIKYIIHYFFGGSMAVNLDTLPSEILPLILRDLLPGQLSSFTACRYLYEVASSDELWKQLCLARKITPLEGRSFKEAFLEYSKGYYRFIEIALREEDVNPNNVPLKKDEIDQKVQEAEILPALLLEAISEEKPALEVRYLIEAGAFKRSVDKETVLKLALGHHYPCEVIELLVEQGAPVSEEILSFTLLLDPDPDCLKLLLFQFLKNNNEFPASLLTHAIGEELPEELILLIIDHCKTTVEHLKHALLLKSLDTVIVRLSGIRGELLSLDLLDVYFCNRQDLFFRLYIRSIHPLTPVFINKAIENFQLGCISFETFSKIVDEMRVAGVKFSQDQVVAINARNTSPGQIEALKLAVAHCEVNPVALIKATFLSTNGEMDLRRYLEIGIHLDLDTQLNALLFPLDQERVNLLAPHIDFSAMRQVLLDRFGPLLHMLIELQKLMETSLNDQEQAFINKQIGIFSELLTQIREEEGLELFEKCQFYRKMAQGVLSSFLDFFDEMITKGSGSYLNLYLLFQDSILQMGSNLLDAAALLNRPAGILSLLQAGVRVKSLSVLVLAAQLHSSPEIIKELIDALDRIDGVKEEALLRHLRVLLSLEHFMMIIKHCSRISPYLLIDCMIGPKDTDMLNALVQAGVMVKQRVLKFAIQAKVEADVFEILLNAADRKVSLEKLLHYAQKPYVYREEIVRLIEERMRGNSL